MSKSPFPDDPAKPGAHRAEGEPDVSAADAPTPTDDSTGPRRTLGVRRPEPAISGDAGGRVDALRRLGVRARFKPNALKPTRETRDRGRHPDSSAPGEVGGAGMGEPGEGRGDGRGRAPGRQPRHDTGGDARARADRSGPRTRTHEPGHDGPKLDRPKLDEPRHESRRGQAQGPERARGQTRRGAAHPHADAHSVQMPLGASPDAVPTAHVAATDGVRLSKIMATRGLCSRREADQIIERGWVFVDGQRVSELGIRIDPDAQIALAPEATRRQSAQVTILLHKPVGYVSGQPEPGYEPAVSLVGADNQFDRATAQRFHTSHLRGLAPAGRLDIDSTGLLVLTQNGRIARQLIGDDSKVDKEYIVRVQGRLDERDLALLNHGLELDGRKLRPAMVEWINEDQLRFVLREGRKRQIRRMCELVGLKVVGLKRTRIGKIRLADLPLGEWRFLRDDERF